MLVTTSVALFTASSIFLRRAVASFFMSLAISAKNANTWRIRAPDVPALDKAVVALRTKAASLAVRPAAFAQGF